MNLVTLITGILLAMAVIELLLQGFPRLKRDLFGVAILVAWAGFTAKYYYGPDIATYVSLYGETGNIVEFAYGHYSSEYEVGYLFFTSLCKTLGMSFWWMTAAISTLFFYAVYLVLRQLRDKRVLALALVVFLMKDLIYAQFRQCLAVSFFVFAIVEAEKWRKSGFSHNKDVLSAVILGAIATTMHKSGLMMVGLTAAYYVIQRFWIGKNTWDVLLMVLLLLTLIPTWDLIEAATEALDMDYSIMHSIRLHLSYMKLRQTNLLIYGMVLVVLAVYARGQTGKSAIVASALVGMIVVVVMYQYYFMVDRLRSYFLLFIVYYAFDVVRDASERRVPYVNLVRQSCELVLVLFLAGKIYSFDKNMRLENGDLLDSCTVFNLVSEDAGTIQKRQMDKAHRFWDSKKRTDSRYAIPDKSKR